MPFPNISPIIFEIGPFALHWYGLAYVAGLYIGWQYIALMARRTHLWGGTPPPSKEQTDALLLWITFAIILGGRLGYVLFYNPAYYLANPNEILAVWQGGMSFHGGGLGALLALLIFAHYYKAHFWTLVDLCAAALPIGLFFGRIANFINSELWGRTTDVAWGVIFPNGGALPRHPSQLYEAALEGLVLFIILNWLIWRRQALAKRGTIAGIFLIGYGISRSAIELVREPDAHIGFVIGQMTMGQLLSLPMVLVGVLLLFIAQRKQTV